MELYCWHKVRERNDSIDFCRDCWKRKVIFFPIWCYEITSSSWSGLFKILKFYQRPNFIWLYLNFVIFSYRKKKGGSYEIIHGVIGPMNHQGLFNWNQTRIPYLIDLFFLFHLVVDFTKMIFPLILLRGSTWRTNKKSNQFHKQEHNRRFSLNEYRYF